MEKYIILKRHLFIILVIILFVVTLITLLPQNAQSAITTNEFDIGQNQKPSIIGIAWDGEAFCFISNIPPKVYRFNPNNQSYATNISLPSQLSSSIMRGIAYDSGYYYILYSLDNSYFIIKVDKNGNIISNTSLSWLTHTNLMGLTIDPNGDFYAFSKNNTSAIILKISISTSTEAIVSKITIPQSISLTKYAIYDLAYKYDAVWAVDNLGRILKITSQKSTFVLNITKSMLSSFVKAYDAFYYVGCEFSEDNLWISIEVVSNGNYKLKFVRIDSSVLNTMPSIVFENMQALSLSTVAAAVFVIFGTSLMSTGIMSSTRAAATKEGPSPEQEELRKIKDLAALRKVMKKPKRKKKKERKPAFGISSSIMAFIGLLLGIGFAAFGATLLNFEIVLSIAASSIGFSTATFGIFGAFFLLRIKRKYKVKVSVLRMFILVISFLLSIYGLIVSPLSIIAFLGKTFGGALLFLSFIISLWTAKSESSKMERLIVAFQQ